MPGADKVITASTPDQFEKALNDVPANYAIVATHFVSDGGAARFIAIMMKRSADGEKSYLDTQEMVTLP
jgi:hypothetical protein